jgi:hypothetical protein
MSDTSMVLPGKPQKAKPEKPVKVAQAAPEVVPKAEPEVQLELLPEGTEFESVAEPLPEGTQFAPIEEVSTTADVSPLPPPDVGAPPIPPWAEGVEVSPEDIMLTEPEPIHPVYFKAAEKGIEADKPAPGGHFVGSLALNENERLRAYEISVKERYGPDASVRMGPDTGYIEYYNPETNRWALAKPPEAYGAQVAAAGGPAIVMGSEVVAGLGGALTATGPVGVYIGASGGALVGEIMRLELGYKMGINQSMTDEEMLESAFKEAGVSLAGGVIGDKIIKFGGLVVDIVKGRSLTRSVLKDLDLSVEEAALLEEQINKVLGAERFKFNLAQATLDDSLLETTAEFAKSQKYSKIFGQMTDEQYGALKEFYDIINRGARSRATPSETLAGVQSVAERQMARETAEADLMIKKMESDIDVSISSIKDSPYENLGDLLREVGDAERQGFTNWSKEAANALNDVAGNKEFIKNDNLYKVVTRIDTDIKEALFPSLEAPTKRVIGEEVSVADKEKILSKIFDPNAEFTFKEAWSAISALKRAVRQSSKGLSHEAPATGDLIQLQKALEKDLRTSAQGSPLRDQYDSFIDKYAKENTRLNKGFVEKLMSRDGAFGPWKVNDDKVFRQFFTPGSNVRAKELHSLVEGSPEALDGIRAGIGDFYKREVLDEGRVNLSKHKAFMEKYSRAAEVFFTKDEMRMFAEPGNLSRALKARTEARARVAEKMSKTFEAEISNLNNPGQLMRLILDPKRPEKSFELIRMLDDVPDVKRGVQNEFRKFMLDRVSGQYKNGDRAFDAKQFDAFLNGKGSGEGFLPIARNMFGEQYANDLRLLNDVLKRVGAEARHPVRGEPDFWASTIKNLARVHVGMFTKAGRMVTAMDKIRVRTVNRAFYRAIANPENLRQLMALRKVDIRTDKAQRLLGALGASALFEGGDVEANE